MLPDGWCGAVAEGVQEADGEGIAHELADSGLVGLAEGGYLVVGGELTTGYPGAEHEGDDLVDAAQGAGLDIEAGLLADLAPQPVPDRLSQFKDTAWGLPVMVVAPLDEQGAAVVVGDDTARE